MDIIGKFKNGTITISNIQTENDEYKCHFQFDINILTPQINYNYHFGESVYFSMFDFLVLKQIKLVEFTCVISWSIKLCEKLGGEVLTSNPWL